MRRTIPRHVDSRVKIGLIPLKNFFKLLPIFIFIILIILIKPTPVKVFLGVLVGAIGYFLGSELNNKETGLDILKDIIRYEKEGDIYFERNTINKSNYKKIINNKLANKIINGEVANDKEII